MTGLSGPLTRVDIRTAPARGLRVEGDACEESGRTQVARGGLYRARRADLTSVSSLAPIAERGVHKGESGDRGGVGAHHPRPQRNGVDEGFCKEERACRGTNAA